MIYLLTFLIAATRFLPHPPNFACLGALGLFAGCYLVGRKAFLLPALALLVSDLVSHIAGVPGMGLYHPVVMLATYGAAIAAVPAGRWVRSSIDSTRVNWWKLPLGILGGSTLFFLISNFGVWLGPWYPATASGLLSCYAAALPFYGYTLAGDLLFASLMFGAYELSRMPRFAPNTLAPAVISD